MRYATEPCPPEHAFHFANGTSARSLEELHSALASAPGDVLHYHRAHFHHWVRDVLQEPALAERIREEGERARDGEHLRRTLTEVLERAMPRTASSFRRR